MVTVLLLGYSSLVQRRLLSVLNKLVNVDAVAIASRKDLSLSSFEGTKVCRLYRDYDSALRSETSALVYISLVNAEHDRWARESLLSGHDTIIDKPSFLTPAALADCRSLAEEKGLRLGEALVYPFHPQVEKIREIFRVQGERPKRIVANFTVPPFPVTDFRYRQELGGGAFRDLGPYACSVGELFFGAWPLTSRAYVVERAESVETAFSLLQTFPGGCSLVGHFGFTTCYQNNLKLYSESLSVSMNRFFTITPELENTILIERNGKAESVSVEACDPFGAYLEAFIAGSAQVLDGAYQRDLFYQVNNLIQQQG